MIRRKSPRPMARVLDDGVTVERLVEYETCSLREIGVRPALYLSRLALRRAIKRDGLKAWRVEGIQDAKDFRWPGKTLLRVMISAYREITTTGEFVSGRS